MNLRQSIVFRSLVTTLAGMLLFGLWACNGDPARTDTSSTATTASTFTGSEVYVEFEGTMSFIFPTTTDVPNRLVIIRGDNIHRHAPLIVLPKDITMSEADLTALLGSPADCTSFGACVFSPVVPIALRIVGTDDKAPKPALAKTANFERFVPSLRDVTKAFGDKEMKDVDEALTSTAADPYPKGGANDPFVAYVEINGGQLDAKPACGRGFYVPTDTSNTNKDVPHEFADSVQWTGKTDAPAKVQVNRLDPNTNKPTGWKDITFKNTKFVHLMVLNEPVMSGASAHFKLHAKVGKDKAIKFPTINHDEDCEAVNKSHVIGCAATEWP